MMGQWEPAAGASDEWYTPRYVFDALGATFDMDVANGAWDGANTPTTRYISENSLFLPWRGFVWMNPPFGGRNGLVPWLNKFFDHGNGIALTPDRTSAPWWRSAVNRGDGLLFVAQKIKFERPNGSLGNSPGSGTTLFASGSRATDYLLHAECRGLGVCMFTQSPLKCGGRTSNG